MVRTVTPYAMQCKGSIWLYSRDGSARRHGAKWKAVGFVSSSEHIKDIAEEKYVLVSHYTSTFNILEAVTIEDGNWNDGQ